MNMNTILDKSLRINSSSTLIVYLMDYCCPTDDDISLEHDDKLKWSLNSCVRFIYYLLRYISTSAYINALKCLRVKNWRKYFVAINLYFIPSSDNPTFLCKLFQYEDSVWSHTTRRNRDYTITCLYVELRYILILSLSLLLSSAILCLLM